ncbi:Hypothetical predicted protein [Mytilus galloprovincialis]|uniref:Uncharacterized protein n=1 Tax=Mytilus galloprovincialis TaxID=29158 RepID=A0A8B6DL16_MYTGA|nr:Hypothetical predicted protein [Mytilus galloprovincialis]
MSSASDEGSFKRGNDWKFGREQAERKKKDAGHRGAGSRLPASTQRLSRRDLDRSGRRARTLKERSQSPQENSRGRKRDDETCRWFQTESQKPGEEGKRKTGKGLSVGEGHYSEKKRGQVKSPRKTVRKPDGPWGIVDLQFQAQHCPVETRTNQPARKTDGFRLCVRLMAAMLGPST